MDLDAFDNYSARLCAAFEWKRRRRRRRSAKEKILLIFVRFPSAQTRHRRSVITTVWYNKNTNGKLSDVIGNKCCERQCTFDDPNKDTTGMIYTSDEQKIVDYLLNDVQHNSDVTRT